MSKLPTISYKELVNLLNQLDYQVDRQRGSHIRMKKILPKGRHSITIPAHKEIAKGTLNNILNKVSQYTNVPKEELLNRLRK